MSFQDVACLPSSASSPPHFLNIVVEVKALYVIGFKTEGGQILPHLCKQ